MLAAAAAAALQTRPLVGHYAAEATDERTNEPTDKQMDSIA